VLVFNIDGTTLAWVAVYVQNGWAAFGRLHRAQAGTSSTFSMGDAKARVQLCSLVTDRKAFCRVLAFLIHSRPFLDAPVAWAGLPPNPAQAGAFLKSDCGTGNADLG
jgi:hypothetical protein